MNVYCQQYLLTRIEWTEFFQIICQEATLSDCHTSPWVVCYMQRLSSGPCNLQWLYSGGKVEKAIRDAWNICISDPPGERGLGWARFICKHFLFANWRNTGLKVCLYGAYDTCVLTIVIANIHVDDVWGWIEHSLRYCCQGADVKRTNYVSRIIRNLVQI